MLERIAATQISVHNDKINTLKVYKYISVSSPKTKYKVSVTFLKIITYQHILWNNNNIVNFQT